MKQLHAKFACWTPRWLKVHSTVYRDQRWSRLCGRRWVHPCRETKIKGCGGYPLFFYEWDRITYNCALSFLFFLSLRGTHSEFENWCAPHVTVVEAETWIKLKLQVSSIKFQPSTFRFPVIALIPLPNLLYMRVCRQAYLRFPALTLWVYLYVCRRAYLRFPTPTLWVYLYGY